MVIAMARRKLSTTVYITAEQDAALKLLHTRTRVPVAEYIRQGIDLVLAKYRDHLPGQVDLELTPGPAAASRATAAASGPENGANERTLGAGLIGANQRTLGAGPGGRSRRR